jgi:hypothetical protein
MEIPPNEIQRDILRQLFPYCVGKFKLGIGIQKGEQNERNRSTGAILNIEKMKCKLILCYGSTFFGVWIVLLKNLGRKNFWECVCERGNDCVSLAGRI